MSQPLSKKITRKKVCADFLLEIFDYVKSERRIELETVSKRVESILKEHGYSNVKTLDWKALKVEAIEDYKPIDVTSFNYNRKRAEIITKRLKQLIDRCRRYVTNISLLGCGLDCTELRALIDSLYNKPMLPKLKHAAISAYGLNEQMLAKFEEDFPDLKSIKYIGAKRHEGAFAQFLQHCRSLESLTVVPFQFVSFWPSFNSLPSTLRRLDISRCSGMSRDALLAIPNKCPGLIFLNLPKYSTKKQMYRDLLKAIIEAKNQQFERVKPSGKDDPRILHIHGMKKEYCLRHPLIVYH